MKIFLNCLILISVLFTSCEKDMEISGKKPIYYSYEDETLIKRTEPRDFGKLGKIVTSGNFIFINEINQGIHVVNNSDPLMPVKEHFWEIPGNTEFTIFNQILYADNGKNLWVIDIADFSQIRAINMVANQYNNGFEELYPLDYSGYFECYNSKLGILKEWRDTILFNPLCKTR